jgi:hypothetical protein
MTMEMRLTEEQIESIATEIENGSKIRAIKELKGITKMSLIESKDIIENYPCPNESYDWNAGKAVRTEEQIEQGKKSADQFRNDMKEFHFMDYAYMRERIDSLVVAFGRKQVLEHIVSTME